MGCERVGGVVERPCASHGPPNAARGAGVRASRGRTGVQLKDKWRNLIKFQHLRRGEAESAPQGDRGGARGGGTAMKKWRIVVLRFGTARQDMVLE